MNLWHEALELKNFVTKYFFFKIKKFVFFLFILASVAIWYTTASQKVIDSITVARMRDSIFFLDVGSPGYLGLRFVLNNRLASCRMST